MTKGYNQIHVGEFIERVKEGSREFNCMELEGLYERAITKDDDFPTEEEFKENPVIFKECKFNMATNGLFLPYMKAYDSDFVRASFRCVDLHGSSIRDSTLFKSDFARSNLSNMIISNSNMGNSYLAETDLSYSSFEGSDLRGSVLRGADVTKTDFTNADLHEIEYLQSLKGLESAIFKNTRVEPHQKKMIDYILKEHPNREEVFSSLRI